MQSNIENMQSNISILTPIHIMNREIYDDFIIIIVLVVLVMVTYGIIKFYCINDIHEIDENFTV